MDVAAQPWPVELSVEFRSEPEAAAGMVAGMGMVVVLPDIMVWPLIQRIDLVCKTFFLGSVVRVNRVEAVCWSGAFSRAKIKCEKSAAAHFIRRLGVEVCRTGQAGTRVTGRTVNKNQTTGKMIVRIEIKRCRIERKYSAEEEEGAKKKTSWTVPQ